MAEDFKSWFRSRGMSPEARYAAEAFEAQNEYEDILEIDENGNVFKPGEAKQYGRVKATALRDPKGEYREYSAGRQPRPSHST